MGTMLLAALAVSLATGSVLAIPAIVINEFLVRRSSYGSRLVFWLTPIPLTAIVIAVLWYEFDYHIEDETDGITTAFRDSIILGLTPSCSLYIGLLFSLLFKKRIHKN